MSDEPSVMGLFEELIAAIKAEKPNDRSQKDRWTQICLTDVQKAYASWSCWVDGDNDQED